jgi:multiple sugar transport system substrate-binding protein
LLIDAKRRSPCTIVEGDLMRHSAPRRYAAAALALAPAFALAACGSGDDAGTADGPVTLTYGIWDKNQEPAMRQIADAFEAANPDVTVAIELTPFSDYWTKLQTAISGGTGPDVFWMNGPNIQAYASNGALEPLGDLDTSGYPQGLVDLYTVDGALYGAPKDFDTIGVWYNKDLFDAAGVDYPSDDWTWDDYVATAERLTDPDAGVWGSAAALNDQQNYYNTIAQAGAEVVSADGTTTGYGTPEALTGLEFWTDQIAAGLSPTQEQMADTSPETLFTSGKVAMYWSGSWSAVAYDTNDAVSDIVDVAPLPAGPQGNQSVIHGVGNVVNAGGEHKDVAARFAEFASSEEAAVIQAEAGAVIPAYDGTQQAWVDAMPHFQLDVYIDALDTAVPYPASRNTSAWTSIQDEVLTQVWSGGLDAADGNTQLGEQVQAKLDAEQE